MNNLKAVVLDVAIGEKFTFVVQNDFFTKDRTYIIESINFDNGTLETDVDVIDNDYETHTLTQKFFTDNFTKAVSY